MEEKNKKQKKILVTGGAGFIGLHLCERLLDLGNNVICVDNLYSGSKENIEKFFKNPHFEFIEHDINKPLKIDKLDEIYNLACPASPVSYQFDPVFTVKANVLGSLNMLELAKKTGARILQASTSEIYGDPLSHPQKETDFGNVNTIGVRSCYDEGKRCAETLFMDYHRERGVDIRIIRIFNTYGPNMALDDGRVVSNFIIQALKNEDITIYGNGSQTRSLQYVDDLIDAMILMMRQKDFIGPVNIGNPKEMTVKQLAERIITLTGSSSKIIYLPQAQDDPKKRNPDITLAHEKLGWQPKVDFEEGIIKTINYFAEQLEIKTNVLVFATAYKPFLGPAEETLHSIIEQMGYLNFHVIAARLDKNLPKKEEAGNIIIYRIGVGHPIDKYLLIFFGWLKAKKLHKIHNFRFVWSLMASYAALAAFIFKIFGKKLPHVMFLHKGDLEGKALRKAKLIFPFYKLIFKKSDAIHVIDDAMKNKLKLIDKNLEGELIPLEKNLAASKVREIHKKILGKYNKKIERTK